MFSLQWRSAVAPLVEEGPYDRLEIFGRQFCVGPERTVLASQKRGLWQRGQVSFVSVTVVGRTYLNFYGDGSLPCGVFDQIRFLDGYISVGDDFSRHLARFRDSHEHWVLLEQRGTMTGLQIVAEVAQPIASS